MAVDLTDRRFARFAGIVPPFAISKCCPIIVGCGAIGSHIARLLAHMGIPKIVLVDPDTVSPENLGPQCYRPRDLKSPKVLALTQQLGEINPNIKVGTYNSLFESSHLRSKTFIAVEDSADNKYGGTERTFEDAAPNVVFSCVDSMAARTTVLDAFKDPSFDAELLIDTRMGGESAFILTATRTPNTLDTYAKTLFPDSEAEPLPCGQTSSPHNAACTASLAVHALSLHLRGTTVRPITCLDLTSLSLFPASHSLLHPTPPPSDPVPTPAT